MEHRKPRCVCREQAEFPLNTHVHRKRERERAARARITLPLDGHSGSGFAFDNEYRLSMESRVFHSSMTPDIGITFSLWLPAPFLLSKEPSLFARASRGLSSTFPCFPLCAPRQSQGYFLHDRHDRIATANGGTPQRVPRHFPVTFFPPLNAFPRSEDFLHSRRDSRTSESQPHRWIALMVTRVCVASFRCFCHLRVSLRLVLFRVTS